MSFRMRCWFQLGCVVVLSSAALAQSQSIPLGDVVRAPKLEKRAARIYTNDDIPSRPSEPVASAQASEDPKNASSSDAKPGAVSEQTKQPASLSKLRQLINRETQLVGEQASLQKLLQAETDPDAKEIWQRTLDTIKRDLQDVQARIAQLPAIEEDGQNNHLAAEPATPKDVAEPK